MRNIIIDDMYIKHGASASELVTLVEEYINKTGHYPCKGHSVLETKIINRICSLKGYKKFTPQQLDQLNSLYRKYGSKGDWMSPDELFQALLKFVEENKFYPDSTKRSGVWGNKLHDRLCGAINSVC